MTKKEHLLELLRKVVGKDKVDSLCLDSGSVTLTLDELQMLLYLIETEAINKLIRKMWNVKRTDPDDEEWYKAIK